MSIPMMTRDSSSEKCCPRQFLGPLMKGKNAHASMSPSPVRGEVVAATPNRFGRNLSTSPPGHASGVWCTPSRLHMTMTPLGILNPPISSSSASSRVTTGTGEWMRSVSRSTLKTFISDSLMTLKSAWWPFLNTSSASSTHSCMSFGEFISSQRAHVSVHDVVSWPANRNVLSPSLSSRSFALVISPSMFPRMRSRMSRGWVSTFPPSNLDFHRAMTCPSRKALRLATRARCRHQSGMGRKRRYGYHMRSLHSSMMGRYKAESDASASSGGMLRTAREMTCRVMTLKCSAMSTSSPVSHALSSASSSFSVTRTAALPTPSKMSSLNVGASCLRSVCHLSPSDVTIPLPSRQPNTL
mmetsp:Transcript_24120/g.60664  ORF Transcript_24120/g.60664 Transcript_24120/m.60664 type:complete len:355 (+) Transcript_24120:317-1381(+)